MTRKMYNKILIISIISISLCGCKHKEDNRTTIRTTGEIPGLAEKMTESSIRKNEELLRTASLEGNLAIVQQMIEQKVEVNAADDNGVTAIMFASFNGYIEIVTMLYEAGALINHKDLSDRTALMYAASGPYPLVVRFLLTKGADPNSIDNQEHFTALMFAAAEGQLEVVKILLENGADPDMKDIDGETALDFARHNGHTNVIAILKE